MTFYADDLAIGSAFHGDVQHALFLLASYCEKNHLKVNVKKTEVMMFRKGGSCIPEPLVYLNEPLAFVKSFVF